MMTEAHSALSPLDREVPKEPTATRTMSHRNTIVRVLGGGG